MNSFEFLSNQVGEIDALLDDRIVQFGLTFNYFAVLTGQ